MKVRITSNGKRYGTKIVDLSTGDEIKHVVRVEFEIDAESQVPFARITQFVPAEIDVTAERSK